MAVLSVADLISRGWGLIPAAFAKLNNGSGGNGGGVAGSNSAMPYDENFYTALNQLQQARNTYFSNLKASKALTNEGFHQQMNDLVKQHPYDIQSLNDNYGASGLGFSSGYGSSLGRLQDAYGTNTDRLREAHLNAINQVKLNRQNYMNEFRANKTALRQAAADRLSANAGSLGLGQNSKASQLSNLVQGGRG